MKARHSSRVLNGYANLPAFLCTSIGQISQMQVQILHPFKKTIKKSEKKPNQSLFALRHSEGDIPNSWRNALAK